MINSITADSLLRMEKKMKKNICFLLILVMISAILNGCDEKNCQGKKIRKK